MEKDWRRVSSTFTVAEIAAFMIGEDLLEVKQAQRSEDEKMQHGESIDTDWQKKHEDFSQAQDIVIRAIAAGDLEVCRFEHETICGYAPPWSVEELSVFRQSYEQWAIQNDFPTPYLLPEERADRAQEVDKKKSGRPHGNILHNARKDVEVLQAALACLAAFPQLCRNKSGSVVAAKLAKLVDQKSAIFWKQGESPRGEKSMALLINDALKKVK